MSNLFRNWKDTNTSNRLEYGIHENVAIKDIDTKARKKNDGSVMRVAMFITYTKVDEQRRPLAEIEEFLFWPKFDSKLGALKSLFLYINHLSMILSCYYNPDEVTDAFDKLISDEGFKTPEDVEKKLNSEKAMKAIVLKINEAFESFGTPLTGLTSEYLFRLKVTCQDNGLGVEIPNSGFIEAMKVPVAQSTLQMTQRDVRAKQEADKPKVNNNLAQGSMPGMPGMPGMPNIPGSAPGVVPGAVPAAPPAATVPPAGVPTAIPGAVAPSIPQATPAAPVQATMPMPDTVTPVAQVAPPTQPFLNAGA